MRNRVTELASALGLLLLAGSAQAQTAKPDKLLPIMRGSVQDTLGRPLEGAMIEIAGLGRRITTSSSGSYRFDDIKPGKYWVVARRIGYAPVQTALTFNRGDNREIDFQLEPRAHVLPEVVVREERVWQSRYQDFVWRSRGAFGYFLTRDDLEKSRATYLGDVVRRYLPFVNSDFFSPAIADFSGFGGRGQGISRGLSSRQCSPAVSVNGGMPSGVWAVNDFRPDQVEALEVYRGSRMMPAQFSGWGTSCGLVVVWTQ
jgi:hypothetical protein